MFYSLFMDLRYTVRLLAKSPGFTAITIAVLAGGMGLCIFTFSFLNTLTLKNLPLADAEHIVRILAHANDRRSLLTNSELAAIRAASSLEHLGGYHDRDVFLSTPEWGVSLTGTYTDASLFDLAGVEPLVGRRFDPEDQAEGAEPVVLLSHKVWRDRFGGDQSVLGKQLAINLAPARVIGVMPKDFAFPVISELWLPLSKREAVAGSDRAINVFARIRSGFSKDRIETELNRILEDQRSKKLDDAESGEARRAFIISFPRAQTDNEGPLLFGGLNTMALLILLMACINIGNLLLARANERSRETAIRAALGAPRLRLIIQTLWETTLICIFGGVLGLLLAGWALEAVHDWSHELFGDKLPFWWQWRLDPSALWAALAVLVLSIALAGGLPAWRATSGDFNAILRDGVRSGGVNANRSSTLLVTVEVVMAFVVMFLGGIVAITAARLSNLDSGAETSDKLTAHIALPLDRYPGAVEQTSFFQELERRLDQSPAIGSVILLGHTKESYQTEDARERTATLTRLSFGSLDLLGIEVLAGRALDDRDRARAPKSVMVSRSFAQNLWPDASPIGQRLRFVQDDGGEDWRTVVGMVKDRAGFPFSRIGEEGAIYAPITQTPTHALWIMLRFSGAEFRAKEQIYRVLKELDPRIAPDRITSPKQELTVMAEMADFGASLFIWSSLFALLLAIMGVYGLTANAITQRGHELGVRRALGASDRQIVGLLLRQGGRRLVIGLGIGAMIAVALARGLAAIVPLDGWVYGASALGVAVLIAVTVAFAIYFPAKRAVKREPNEALHTR